METGTTLFLISKSDEIWLNEGGKKVCRLIVNSRWIDFDKKLCNTHQVCCLLYNFCKSLTTANTFTSLPIKFYTSVLFSQKTKGTISKTIHFLAIVNIEFVANDFPNMPSTSKPVKDCPELCKDVTKIPKKVRE